MLQFKILKSELFKNISILVSGTALAQLIPILLQPVLRRYYTPEAFGAYSVYLSLLGILIVVASFKYELAIILPKKDKEAANIFFLTVILSLVFNSFIFLVVICYKDSISVFINLPNKYSNYLHIIPLGTVLYSFYQSINYWLIRKKKFIAISQNKFIRRGSEGLGQIGFKYLQKPLGLVYGDIIGHISNIISASIQSFNNGLKIRLFSFNKIKYVIKRYAEYPKYNVIPSFLSACSYLLPAIFINKFFSSEFAGYFDLSKLVLSIPLALIATSLSNVLLQRVSEKYKKTQSFVKELFPILLIILVIAIFEIVIISCWGVDLFRFVFGKEWSMSGKISQILIWSFALNFIVASFSSIFISMKRIKLLSIWQLFYFLSIFSLIFFKDFEFLSFLRIYLFFELTCGIIISFLIIYVIKNYEKQICRNN